MDLRSLCSKLDIDALRAKIPPLPQIKLPKSMSKLRSRKIFRSSREDINSISRHASSKRKSNNSENSTLPLGPPFTIPPSEFINRTPNRISTISSLMNQKGDGSGVSRKWKTKSGDEENFYRSAGGIEDYYPSPLNQRFDQRVSRPISPVKAPPITQEFRAQSEQNIRMSLGERFQKSYKDVTDFKLKHLFSKKTVVRTDKIEITEYINRFDEDRKREERVKEKIDRDIAENYKFQFKVSQQKFEESFVESPGSTPKNLELKKNQKTVSEFSGDESGMESSPPPRKPGIASTRFSRVRHTPLNMSLEEPNDDDDGIHVVKDDSPKRNLERTRESQRSSRKLHRARDSCKVYEMRHTSMEEDQDEENNESCDDYELDVKDENSPKNKAVGIKKPQKTTPEKTSPRKSKSIKERMSRFTKQNSAGDEKKRKAPLTPQQSEENEEPTKSDKPFDAIKQNFKRLQKSIKLPQHTQPGVESENEETNPENKTIFSKTQHFTERLKRFRSTDHVDKNTEEDENKESPIHKISNKLQEWKKSIRRKVDLQNTDNDDDYTGGSPQKSVGSLMKKLKHIRSRKRDSTDDPDDDEEGGETYKESLTARAKLQLEKGVVVASQVPQRTMKKISETKKYFKKKTENDIKKSQSDEEEEEDEHAKPSAKEAAKSVPRPPPPRPPSLPRPQFNNNSSEEDTDEREAFIAKSIAESQLITVPTARAVWTTKPILSDDTTDYDDEMPRVLLHQDNSDVFESTLIIAVTRPISRMTTPIITELPPDSADESTPDTKPDNWIPNQDKIANFLDMTPPLTRKLSKDSNTTPSSKGHSRKDSIDSSSEDSWIKDIPRGPSIAVLNSVVENEEPWKIANANPENNLYKTKSIDLFEMQKKHGGVLTAFEDFDDELKNTPVVKIANKEPQQQQNTPHPESSERESSEEIENPDDDNSSRITKISIHPPNNSINEETKTESGLKPQPYGNSRESLAGILNDKDVIDSGEEEDNEESDDEDDERDIFKDVKLELDRPPSKTPSPPPSKLTTPPSSKSPTPPPLPQRKPSISLSKLDQSIIDLACPLEPPPPLPQTKPPIPPNRPSAPAPKIPDRNHSTTRASKPLVKTASLRLAYSEQVNPEDVGKVNKLISRFEPEGPKQRPRIIPRKPWLTNESEENSDEEDTFGILPTKPKEKFRDTTPTNHPRIQKSFSIDSLDLPNNNERLSTPSREIETSLTRKATSQIVLDNSECATPIPSISISSSCLDVNSNFSQPSSVYGSPLPYPSSLVGSTEVTPLTIRKESENLGTRRNRRSMARDDEHFYSFDSDEENSYYSISSTSSNRYVVEL